MNSLTVMFVTLCALSNAWLTFLGKETSRDIIAIISLNLNSLANLVIFQKFDNYVIYFS